MSSTVLPAAPRTQRARLHLDPMVIGLTSALLLLGIVMVGSASIVLAARDGDPFYFLERQLLFSLVGILLGAFALRIRTDEWQRLSYLLLGAGLVLLLLVLIPGLGAKVNGSRRWLHLFGLNFQASEAARVCMLIYLCSYAVRREQEIRTTLVGLLKALVVLLAAAVLLLCEPDMGSGVVLLATGTVVLFLAGARLRDLSVVLLAGSALFAVVAMSSNYRVQRLKTFLNPWLDPLNQGYQLIQSEIAIGRGEWFGVGLGASVQKHFYLPEGHTDFVFAVLAEELGFLGVFLLVALMAMLAYRALVIARNAAEAGLKFQSYLAASFGVWLAVQAFVNMGVNMGLLPTKGLTLPLLSYGRSSLVVTLAWIGLLLRVHHETQSSRSIPIRGSAR